MQSASGSFNGSLHDRSSQTVSFEAALQQLVSSASSAGQTGVQASGPQPAHLYLAQSTIWAQGQAAAPLAPLLLDIQTPACLQRARMQHINLWLSTR